MERLMHNARRVSQTLRHFDAGTTLLREIARPAQHPELVFRVDGGPTIHCPNRAGARVPVYELFADDSYRLDTLLAGLPAAPTVLDIGGHIGCFSVAVATRLPGAHVESYEASPSTAAWLIRNVAANGLTGRVTVHAEAVADHEGTVSFEDNDAGSSLNRLSSTTATGSSAVTVPSVTLAQVFARCATPPALVKIDTEGAEYAMVLASDPALWAPVQRVVLEYHDVAGHDWAELEAHFALAGLRLRDREVENPRQGMAWLDRT